MAFIDKLNQLASAATEMAGDAIELGKQNLKITTEERRVKDLTEKMGGLVLEALDAGADFGGDIAALYEEIKASRLLIASIRADLAQCSGLIVCPACQEKNTLESKFCKRCGAKLEEPAPEEAKSEAREEVLCPHCSALVGENQPFCTQCGGKLD